MNRVDFKKMFMSWRNHLSSKKISSRDVDDHYDLDGVSFSTQGVVVAGDNQTTEAAPPPQKSHSRFRMRTAGRAIHAPSRDKSP